MSEYSVMRAAEAPDYTGEAPGAFFGYARSMGSAQLGLNVRVLAPHTVHKPPGDPDTGGHSHRTIEEIYFVLKGSGRMEVDGATQMVRPGDAILIPAGAWHSLENNGTSELRILCCCAPPYSDDDTYFE